jgi:hypothetical protein
MRAGLTHGVGRRVEQRRAIARTPQKRRGFVLNTLGFRFADKGGELSEAGGGAISRRAEFVQAVGELKCSPISFTLQFWTADGFEQINRCHRIARRACRNAV